MKKPQQPSNFNNTKTTAASSEHCFHHNQLHQSSYTTSTRSYTVLKNHSLPQLDIDDSQFSINSANFDVITVKIRRSA